jgi:hypothetical protein
VVGAAGDIVVTCFDVPEPPTPAAQLEHQVQPLPVGIDRLAVGIVTGELEQHS